MKLIGHERADKENARDDYETPNELFRSLDCVYGKFNLDVCATSENRKVCQYFGPDSDLITDALLVDWADYGDRIWCNPPFSHWPEFMKAAVKAADRADVVFLIPPRCGTVAFHEFVPRASEIIILQGRASFLLDGVPQDRNGGDSVVLVFRPRLKNAIYGTPSTVFWDWKKGTMLESKRKGKCQTK